MIRQAEDAFEIEAAGGCLFQSNTLKEGDFAALKEFRKDLP